MTDQPTAATSTRAKPETQTETTPRTKRVLSGVQPSGQLHLGNYVGAIRQFIDLQQTHEMFIFVASYHALTAVRDPERLRQNIRQVVIDYMAFGLEPGSASDDKPGCYIYLQHDVPRVTELTWLLSCVCPKSQMDKATSYKDKIAKGLSPSIGLYTYPILQAADILAVNPDFVPVGEDQRQHVEITRDLAQRFNHAYAADEPVFREPEPMINPGVSDKSGAVLPGIDGQKMSKSYNNVIDPFLPEKKLRKTVMRIVTDSTPVDDPKDPDRDNVFALFRGLAGPSDSRTDDLATRYRAGGLSYGQAKQELYELIMDHFAPARRRRAELENDPGYIDQVLKAGAQAANEKAAAITNHARSVVGLD